MEIRRTTAADVSVLFDIFNAAMRDVYLPHGFDPPAPPRDVFATQQQHLLEHDGELCAVAESGGAVVGFASAWMRDDSWFLASLFVHPDVQARGLGARLLDAAWAAAGVHRRTVTDAIQPVSNALYTRRGLVPATPVLAFAGAPAVHTSEGGDLEVEAGASAADATELRDLDAAAYGFDRTIDHRLWERAAQRTVWRRDGRTVAYSYAFPDGTIGPVAGVDGVAAAAALRAELSRADRAVRVRIPGTSRELVEVAVSSGLRLGPTPGLLLLGPGTPAPRALAIGGYTLL
jgi:GNAT superfamily N-acetyltransferase